MNMRLYRLILVLLVVLILLVALALALEHRGSDDSTRATIGTDAATMTPSTQTTIESAATPSTISPTVPSIAAPMDVDFVRITDYVSNVRVELRYATENNFTNQVIYDFTQAWLRYGTVKKLMQAADGLENLGFGLVIWDAYRPLYAQQALWDVCPDPNYVSKPGTGRQTHCRGIAVDITLYDLETGVLLEMPSDFDEFSALGDRDYCDCTVTARENALILEKSMENAGFQPYFGEWWHFSDTVEYPVEESLVPDK